MATAVQILCVIACKGADGITSEIVARSLRTNPVVVRRLLKSLQHAGLVVIRAGKDGGVRLGQLPERITLADIHHAIEPDAETFALRPAANPNCPVAMAMGHLLGPIFAATAAAVASTLARTTLGTLVEAIEHHRP